jgi:hypothetical protein
MKNIDLLIEGIKEIIAQNKTVSMRHFRANEGAVNSADFVVQTEQFTPCGTCGCILGNLPFLGIPQLELLSSDLTFLGIPQLELLSSDCSEGGVYYSFYRYCERVFRLKDYSDLYDFLFGSNHSDCAYAALHRAMHVKLTGTILADEH